jgi:hypothetical protein
MTMFAATCLSDFRGQRVRFQLENIQYLPIYSVSYLLLYCTSSTAIAAKSSDIPST